MKRNILIAEDEELLREMIVIVLNDENFVTCQAQNGREAVDILNNQSVDLVLSDLSMPIMDGQELGIYCQRHFPHIPFVLMSGGSGELQIENDDRDSNKAGEKISARYVLKKPFELKQFLEIINKCFPDHAG